MMRTACEHNSTMVITQANKTNITSPNWPYPYPAHSKCTWEITASHGVKIQLTLKGYLVDERYVFKHFHKYKLCQVKLLNYTVFCLNILNYCLPKT